MNAWGAVRFLFGRCPEWRHVPGDLGASMRVYCEKGNMRWHKEHRWADRTWYSS